MTIIIYNEKSFIWVPNYYTLSCKAHSLPPIYKILVIKIFRWTHAILLFLFEIIENSDLCIKTYYYIYENIQLLK